MDQHPSMFNSDQVYDGFGSVACANVRNPSGLRKEDREIEVCHVCSSGSRTMSRILNDLYRPILIEANAF